MRRWNAGLLVLTLVLGPEISFGEGPDTTLLSQQRWVQFEVILGRITATHLRGQGRRTREAGDDHRQEQMTVNGDLFKPSVHYELTTADQVITIDFVDRTTLDIVARPLADQNEPVIRFRQESTRPVTLTVRRGEEKALYRGQSLWHLLLSEPDVCQLHLLPYLEVMRSDWRLGETAAQIENELFRSADHYPQISRRHLETLVKQLGATSFADRQRADWELRDMGVSILPFLQQLDLSNLSGEQRMRISRLQEHLRAPAADSVSRVTAWLAQDRAIWIDLLNHQEAAKREAAVSQLTDIHPGKIKFDPFAEEARRNEQIAQLRLRLRGY